MTPSVVPSRIFYGMILLFIGYFFTAIVGSYLHSTATSPALIWPPAGIALAGLLLGGVELWPAIALASILQLFLTNSPVLTIIFVSFANVAQAIVAVFFLKKFKFQQRLERLSDAFILSITALFASMIVPTIGVSAQILRGTLSPSTTAIGAVWGPWWAGEILSILVITPFLLRWARRPRQKLRQEELTEALVAFAFLIAVDIFLFWTPYTSVATVSLIYVMLIPLFWISLRIGTRGTTLALLLNAVITLEGTAFGYPATHELTLDLGTQLLQSEIFLIIISIIFLILVSVAEERKNAATALQDHVVRLENAIVRISREDEAKSVFIATLAHELRNPLAPLVSSLEIMRLGEMPSEDRHELVEGMVGSINTMRRLLNDLLDISRISRRKLTLQKELVQLQTVITQSIRMATPLIEERKHTLSVVIPDEPIFLEADSVRLEQILVNLLNNSAKYTPEGGQIQLEVTVTPGAICIAIKDNGIGISPELLEHIFDPFMQVDHVEHKMGGLGIGLSLTNSLVDMHGGTIVAKSEGRDKGSEFIVRMPYIGITEEDFIYSNEAKHVSSFLSSFMRPDFKILVVDDNQTAANSLQKLLTLRGYEVATAYNGKEALERLTEFGPKVIMLDIGLPDMNGYEVARQMRENKMYQGTIIALTGYGQETDKRVAEGAGFDYHLTKPAGLAEIEAILGKVT